MNASRIVQECTNLERLSDKVWNLINLINLDCHNRERTDDEKFSEFRFQEKEPATTTVVPDTTTASGQGRQGETTTVVADEATTTTTETPTTTAEPLPYDVHYLTVSSVSNCEVVF